MATKPRKQLDKIERRDFLKKTGTVAGAIATGFPGIISGRTLTNALKVGLVGCGGRGSGAAAQALTADPNNELTAVADIDEAIVEKAATRLRASTKFGGRVKIDHAFFESEVWPQSPWNCPRRILPNVAGTTTAMHYWRPAGWFDGWII